MLRSAALLVLAAGCGGSASPASAPVAVGAPAGGVAAAEAAPSYDEAVEGAPAESLGGDPLDAGARVTLTTEDLQAPLRNTSFTASCHQPAATHVTARLAIRDGVVAGCTVTTEPSDAKLATCIDHALRRLRWKESSTLDTLTVGY